MTNKEVKEPVKTATFNLTLAESDLIIIALDNAKLQNYTATDSVNLINNLRAQYQAQQPKDTTGVVDKLSNIKEY